jgi:hypothetical protein
VNEFSQQVGGGASGAAPSVRRWFLSFNFQGHSLGEGLASALRCKDPDARIYFAPMSMRAGGMWLPQLAQEIAEATVFVLLVGEKGIGPWQAMEYYEALHRHSTQHDLPIVPMLLDGQPAPGLPFLRQLHWVITADPACDKSLAQLMDAAAGGGAPPGDSWRHTRPYRGLEAMTEANSDYFFGRERETVEVISALASERDKLPVLLGNSGVGKSSLALAGVLAALLRQGWPEQVKNAGPWPTVFERSRHWCFLGLRPGNDPLKPLVDALLERWQFKAGAERIKEEKELITLLRDDNATLSDLLDETEKRYRELGQPTPPAFFLYIDQGEELYVRSDERQRRHFSEILAQGVADPRFHTLMSLRADFFGELQKDEPLFRVHRLINVPPLREDQLREVVRRPANELSARFEADHLAQDIARRTAEESANDAGALPLLSYLLDDMWTQMVMRGDGVLRLPSQSIDIGRVLVDRADKFVADHPDSEDTLRRIFTLKLATVREGEEPTRRRATRSEFTDEEWGLVSELADHLYRLLVTAAPEVGAIPSAPRAADTDLKPDEIYAEVAHEAIFRRWNKLREWIAAEREFLAWRTGLEAARKAWETAPDGSKNDALLMGFALTQALRNSATRRNDIPRTDLGFIELSQKTALRRKLRVQALVGGLAKNI